MPELPEVETTRRGIAPFVTGRVVERVLLRRKDLRWPIPRELVTKLPGQRIAAVQRRAKYLLLHTQAGSALLHLGMSGSLRIADPDLPPRTHDHYDLVFDSGQALRFNDPRRFGCLLWQKPGETHPLLRNLGPEPLGDAFDGDWLWNASRGRSAVVKTFLMDQAIVVGVGNIYASEALHVAHLSPLRRASTIATKSGLPRPGCARLVAAIKSVLRRAISLKESARYRDSRFRVYDREGERCPTPGCRGTILRVSQAGRSTFYCPVCQR